MIGQKALSKLAQLQGVESANVITSNDNNTQQLRNKSVLEGADRWLASLPSEEFMASLASLDEDQTSLSSLQRCLGREVSRGRSALSLVRKDLESIKYVFIERESLYIFRIIEYELFELLCTLTVS